MNGCVAIDIGSHDVSLSLQKLLNNNDSSSRWGRMQGRVVVFVNGVYISTTSKE